MKINSLYCRRVPPGHDELHPEPGGPHPPRVHDDVSALRHRRPPLLAADPHHHRRGPGHRVQDQQQGSVVHLNVEDFSDELLRCRWFFMV